jgi:cation/acetate symporter
LNWAAIGMFLVFVVATLAITKWAASDEIRVSRIATIFLCILAIFLGYVFENQNVAFMAGLLFAVAASCNFPVLLLSMFWPGLTTRGALIGGFLGLVSAVVMVVLSKAVWVQTFGFGQAVFPYDNPRLFSMVIGFGGCWLFSVLDRSAAASAERAAFGPQYVRSQTGLGIATAASH